MVGVGDLKMTPVLFVGSIYVTRSVSFKENLKSPSSCNPHQPGLGTGMLNASNADLGNQLVPAPGLPGMA